MRRDCGFEAGQRVTGLSPPLSASPQVGKGEGVESESEMGGKKKGEKFPRPPRVRPCVTVCVARIFMRYITYSGK